MNLIKHYVDIIVKKPEPKHNLNMVQALNQRQLGTQTNFKQKVSNSLFCANRLQIEDKLTSKPVSAMRFDPTGKIIASVTVDLHLNLWLWNKKIVFYTKKSSHSGIITNVKFLNLCGGYHIVTGGKDGEVRYQYIAENGVRLDQLLTKYDRYPEAITIDQTQPQVFLSCGDKCIQRHDLRLNLDMSIDRFFQYNCKIYHMDTNPRNFNEFLICAGDGTIRMFDQRNTKAIVNSFSIISRKKRVPRSAFYSHNGEEILGTYRHGLCLFDSSYTMYDSKLAIAGSNNISLQNRAKFFGSQSNYVVSGSDCGNLFVWQKECGSLIKCTLGDELGAIMNVECHPHEPYLCSVGAENNIKIWSPLYEGNGNVPYIVEKNLTDLLPSRLISNR